MNEDVQRYMCKYLYSEIVREYITERYDNDPEHKGETKAVVRTPEHLSELALVCKLWHEELQLRRKDQVDNAVTYFINIAPSQTISLVNVDMHTPADWAGMPSVTGILLVVYLGSRQVYEIWMERTCVRVRAKDDEDEDDEDEDDGNEGATYQLSIGCRVFRRTDGGDWFSSDMEIQVHELCLVPGNAFGPDDIERYDVWRDATVENVRVWLQQEYTVMTAPPPTPADDV
jgi:hypothetical protein